VVIIGFAASISLMAIVGMSGAGAPVEGGVSFLASTAEAEEAATETEAVTPENTSPKGAVEIVTEPAEPKEGPAVPTIDDVQTVLSQFSSEPSVQEIQEVAMRFAEVHPDLIEGWRKGAKYRALLPEFTMTIDQGRKFYSRYEDIDQRKLRNWTELEDKSQTSPNTLYDIYDKARTRDEQELLTRSRLEDQRTHDRDLRLKFQWDLGDFLYNKEQVRISDEARDLVELRNDVLEEVTQFYFQRRNAQIDLLLSPPEDLRDRLRLELQLQEVTANIDYLTGGYLTQRLDDVKTGKVRKPSVIKRIFNI